MQVEREDSGQGSKERKREVGGGGGRLYQNRAGLKVPIITSNTLHDNFKDKSWG